MSEPGPDRIDRAARATDIQRSLHSDRCRYSHIRARPPRFWPAEPVPVRLPAAEGYDRLVSGRDYRLHVGREDGEELLLDGLALARAFFIADPSAQLGGYDALAGLGNPDRVVVEDIVAMNTTMRSRSKHSLWDPVLASEQRWLRAIPTDLDLVEADDAEWVAISGDTLLADAIRACIHPGIGLAGATKLLHLKRPRLIPILDQLVAEMMGVSLPATPTVDQRVAIAVRLVSAIRREARRNIGALERIRTQLAAVEITRPLIRIFDAILWFAHPAASVAGARRSIAVRLQV